MSFCVEVLHVVPQLRPLRGVLRAPAIAVSTDARRAADLLLQQAGEQADAILAQAGERAQLATLREQARVTEEATALLGGLRQAQAHLLEEVSELAIELARQAFERLVADTVPAERIAAAVRRVREQAPSRLLSAVASVHPEDIASLAAQGDAAGHLYGWELRADALVTPGSCRLEASSGEWHASFSLGAKAMSEALAALAGQAGASARDAVDEVGGARAKDEPEEES